MTENKVTKWRETDRVRVLDAYTVVDKVTYELPNGARVDMFVKVQKPAVCILALTESLEVVLVEQYRPGPDKVLLELPGGAVEDGEEPSAAAVRELLEETGFGGNVQFVAKCLDDAYSTVVRSCFVATGCKVVAGQTLDATEFIKVRLVTLDAFKSLLRSGQMTDVEVGFLGLDFLKLL